MTRTTRICRQSSSKQIGELFEPAFSKRQPPQTRPLLPLPTLVQRLLRLSCGPTPSHGPNPAACFSPIRLLFLPGSNTFINQSSFSLLTAKMGVRGLYLTGFEDLLPDFASCPLYMGGDVGANTLHVIHGVHSLRDSIQVIPGVYMGGINSMKASVQRGESNPDAYRWFVRYAGWSPGQLERELEMGVWYLASSSKEIILKPCIKLPKPLWREILEYMGEPYVDISRRAYGEI